MRSRFPVTPLPSEAAEFAEDIERAFQDLGRTFGGDSLAGECVPPVDVYERDDSIDIVVDLPGVDPSAIRLAVKRDTVLIVGEKTARRARADSSFHLVERDFGRFVRTVHILRACDMGRARATVANGELHISLPKIPERRGRSIQIPISSSQSQQ